MTEGEARALLEDCLRVLFYRDCRALNRIQIGKVRSVRGRQAGRQTSIVMMADRLEL